MAKYRKVAPEYKRKWSFGRQTTLHRAIYEASIGFALPKCVHVHHINGDKTDNRIENLMAVPARIHGTMHAPSKYSVEKVCQVCGDLYKPHKTKRLRSKTCGRACHLALSGKNRRKLNDQQRQEVFDLASSGMTQTAIAKHFGVTQAAIWAILNR